MIKKRILSLLLILCMAVTLLPTAVFAEDATGKLIPAGGAKIGNTVYATLDAALQAAKDNDTIYLGEGTYNSYTSTVVQDKHLSLTFVGAGIGKTTWNIGTGATDARGQDNGDFSFRGNHKLVFKDMTLKAGVTPSGDQVTRNYMGFAHTDITVVEDCVIDGLTFYWGYESATFKNTTFNCPKVKKYGFNVGEYAIWTYSSPVMTFDNCTFNSHGKVINVYTDYSAGKHDITVNFKNCKVNNKDTFMTAKSVLNINDSNMGDYKYTLNISGDIKVFGVSYDSKTCSLLFGYSSGANNTGKTVVNFGDTTGWQDGKMVDAKAYHNEGVTVDDVTYDNDVAGANDSLHAEGYKDNKVQTTATDWVEQEDGIKTRTITKTCEYCDYKEETTEIDWNVPKSKTATRLDTNTWASDVTLSLFDGTATVVLPDMPGNQTQGVAYTVGAGSTVEDKMGDAFDFVPGSLKLTVGGTELQSKADGNVTYFGDRAENLNENDCRFKVRYIPEDDAFVWTINKTLDGSQSVQLTYTVKLTKPETDPGTYGVEDLNGEKTLSDAEAEKALFTNAYAVLNAKNSTGAPVKAQEFPKPSVSYTVKSSGSPAIIAAAYLNTKDHYSYLVGYSDGTVRPNGRITRAEVATIFFRLLTDDTRQRNWSSENNFSDVSADKWYNNAVSTLCHMGVLGGYSDGTFRPNAPITRAEFAKIAVSFAQINGFSEYGYFTDVDSSDWYAPYVDAAKSVGLIEGYSDGSFKPENKITRAEACTIVNRVLGRKPSKNNMKISDRINWPDCTTDDWFYEAVMEATNSHTYQMGKRAETWNDKLPQRDWAALENNWASAYTGKGGEVH